MTHRASSLWLVSLLALCTAIPAAGRITTLTPDEIGVIRNPEAPSDCRLLVRFEPPQELRGAEVDLAILEFTAGVSCPDDAPGLALDAYAVASPWDGHNVEWDDGWDTPGGDIDRELHAVWTAIPSDTARIRLDLTTMMNLWMSEGYGNHGLIVGRARGETGGLVPRLVEGGSSAGTEVTIWYTPHPRR
jgi:hypothetical protein